MRRTQVAAVLCVIAAVSMAGAPASAAAGSPRAWIGAPQETVWMRGGAWPEHPGIVNVGNQGQANIDLGMNGKKWKNIHLYAAAPTGTSFKITAKVLQIGETCSKAKGRDGGRYVMVGISANGKRIGQVTYGHIVPKVKLGQVLKRWGSLVGVMRTDLPKNEFCWTGPHVHIELSNIHGNKYMACYNGTFNSRQKVKKKEFIGFVGGKKSTTTGQACP